MQLNDWDKLPGIDFRKENLIKMFIFNSCQTCMQSLVNMHANIDIFKFEIIKPKMTTTRNVIELCVGNTVFVPPTLRIPLV